MPKRRTLGPAYERAPAEKLSEWSNRNLLILLSSVFCIIFYWALFNVVVDHLLNFLATSGDETAEPIFWSDHPLSVTAKVIGAIVIILVLCKTKAK